jgi:S-formylglutathione hydrolase FrmB
MPMTVRVSPRARMLRRRGAALAVLAAVAAGGWLQLGGSADGARAGAQVVRLTFDSRAVGRREAVSIVIPAGGSAGRPLLVFLHGRGGDDRSSLHDPLFAALGRLGDRAPVIAFPDGGDHSYWHDRRDGAWGRYVMREVIPRVLQRTGADRRRLAVGGISMGGFGAYDLARLHPGRFCAVGGHSPALWQSAGETAPGAFDDGRDFARHDVLDAARLGAGGLTGTPLWLDAGDADPFRPGDGVFAARLRAAAAHPRVHIWPGGHDGAYWDRHWAAYLRFYATALARCAR